MGCAIQQLRTGVLNGDWQVCHGSYESLVVFKHQPVWRAHGTLNECLVVASHIIRFVGWFGMHPTFPEHTKSTLLEGYWLCTHAFCYCCCYVFADAYKFTSPHFISSTDLNSACSFFFLRNISHFCKIKLLWIRFLPKGRREGLKIVIQMRWDNGKIFMLYHQIPGLILSITISC